MPLSKNDKKIVRLMIRDGETDEKIDAIASDDAAAIVEIAAYKAKKLDNVTQVLSRNMASSENLAENITRLTALKTLLEA